MARDDNVIVLNVVIKVVRMSFTTLPLRFMVFQVRLEFGVWSVCVSESED